MNIQKISNINFNGGKIAIAGSCKKSVEREKKWVDDELVPDISKLPREVVLSSDYHLYDIDEISEINELVNGSVQIINNKGDVWVSNVVNYLDVARAYCLLKLTPGQGSMHIEGKKNFDE